MGFAVPQNVSVIHRFGFCLKVEWFGWESAAQRSAPHFLAFNLLALN